MNVYKDDDANTIGARISDHFNLDNSMESFSKLVKSIQAKVNAAIMQLKNKFDEEEKKSIDFLIFKEKEKKFISILKK